MGDINIARQLLAARHKKKITQEELAAYIGVSKAAVSKWESGTSFPDITLLPKLATYYNISIDDLMGYEPQMTKEEIRETYHQLKKLFAEQTWAESYAACQELEKKYYSCFPFLRQLIVLYINHAPLGENPQGVYAHCIELAERVRLLTEDVNDAKEATSLEAMCYILAGDSMKALDLLDQQVRPRISDMEMLIQVYGSLGQVEQAKKTGQIAIYQYLTQMLSDMTTLLRFYETEEARAYEVIRRAEGMIDLFHVEQLNPNTAAVFYLAAALIFVEHGKEKEALAELEKYVSVCEHDFFPYALHGDGFFDAIDGWFEEFDLGTQAPRSEALIRKSIVASVKEHPAFTPLAKNKEFQRLVKRLEKI